LTSVQPGFTNRTTAAGAATSPPEFDAAAKLQCLEALERKVLWLAVWMVHHANHIRPKRDGLKVGGHQASSASVTTLLTALYFDALRPSDRVAVKPHASPAYHAIQYLAG
jgi:pyruvate dehydrogenase E1 component